MKARIRPRCEGFLDWFEKGASEVKRDMEQGAGAVRVMTVHGAKGLEANIVILPDTAQIAEQEARAGLLYTEDCVFFGVTKALNTPAIEAAKAEAARREMREHRRLLYVAMTRAREWLILSGYETRNGPRPDSWYQLIRDAARRHRGAKRRSTARPSSRSAQRCPTWVCPQPKPKATEAQCPSFSRGRRRRSPHLE